MRGGTDLGRVRGLGSAKEGAHHWWNQRMTAAGNLALMTWFIVSLALLPGYDHATVAAWLSSAWTAVPLLLLVFSVFWHMRLGLQVVIEDYQHDETRIVLIVLLNFYTVAAGAIALFAILKLAFGNPA
ncbi:MAG: succinate dehydrogenase, hydrophobic membrane anchor protein [Pseudomonadota bacterium]